MPTEYRLSLEVTSSGLQAAWQFEQGSSTSFAVKPALSPGEVAEHRWYLLFPGPGDHARARAFEQRLGDFGRALHQALYHQGRDILATTDGKPSLLTLVSASPEALSLPWELLRDDQAALVLRDVILRRQLPMEVPRKPLRIPGLPLRVLLVIARPTDAGPIDARSSARPMLDALDKLGGRVHVDLCDPPTLAELERRLGEVAERPRVLALGHGVGGSDPGAAVL